MIDGLAIHQVYSGEEAYPRLYDRRRGSSQGQALARHGGTGYTGHVVFQEIVSSASRSTPELSMQFTEVPKPAQDLAEKTRRVSVIDHMSGITPSMFTKLQGHRCVTCGGKYERQKGLVWKWT